MNFTKEYNEALIYFPPAVVGDVKFGKIYYAYPENLIKYINNFALPNFYHISDIKDAFPDFCNALIKIFKCQIDMNPEHCIQKSDDIIDTIIKMFDLLHLSVKLAPEKKSDLLNDLTYIFRNLYINGACDTQALINFYTSFGGNLKDIGITSIETEYDSGEKTKVYVTRRDE